MVCFILKSVTSSAFYCLVKVVLKEKEHSHQSSKVLEKRLYLTRDCYIMQNISKTQIGYGVHYYASG